MTNSLRDGLGYEELGQPGSQVSNEWITGSVVCAGVEATGLINTTKNITCTGSVVMGGKTLTAIGTGSPTTYGKVIQCGSSALGAGSQAWVVYGTAFGTIPTINLQALTTAGNNDLTPVTQVVGSVLVQGKVASEVFFWTALG